MADTFFSWAVIYSLLLIDLNDEYFSLSTTVIFLLLSST